ncbi:cytidine triphosphate synthase [Trypanosoma grayi]|uniref:cytidine triphosphate synthase n=1 Tax=Trypanosoma grayi TaxID=71804 RepID=UPI0004F463F4|nr:cytidine triphosphate synthase [Trypanosoma grayi]KEG07347.1 cytidine triphosphate synthase [Trypanosoma grayi]
MGGPPHASGVLVADGAMGTVLESWGVEFERAGPMWSSSVLLSDEALVQRVHQAYVDAGCDVLLTCTYQMYGEGCAASEVSMTELVDRAVRTARRTMPARKEAIPTTKAPVEAATLKAGRMIDAVGVFSPAISSAGGDATERTILLAGSLGPYGCSLPNGQEYRGDYDVDDSLIEAFHGGRLEAFTEQLGEETHLKVDFLLFETFPRLDEALGIIAWMQRRVSFRAVPVCFSFVAAAIKSFFPEDGDNSALEEWWRSATASAHLPDGNTFESVLYALQKCHPFPLAGIGCNCAGPLEVGLVASAMLNRKRCTEKEPALALLLSPNSGETYKDGQWYHTPQALRTADTKGSSSSSSSTRSSSLLELQRKLAQGGGDVCTCVQFIMQLLQQRPAANDWLFKVVVFGTCYRSTPEDTAALKAMCC